MWCFRHELPRVSRRLYFLRIRSWESRADMLRKFRNVRWDDHPKLTSPNGPSPLKNSLPAKVRIGNLNLAYRSRESSEIVVFNDNLRRDADQGSGRSENAKHSGANCWEAKSVIGLLCGACVIDCCGHKRKTL